MGGIFSFFVMDRPRSKYGLPVAVIKSATLGVYITKHQIWHYIYVLYGV